MAAPSQPDLEAVVRALQGVRAALAATPLSAALEPPVRDLVVLYETQTVGDALQTLAAWNLLSAPVVKGGPPWLHGGAVGKEAATASGSDEARRARSPSPPYADVGGSNPAMSDLLGFLSVAAIMRAFVAGACALRCAALRWMRHDASRPALGARSRARARTETDGIRAERGEEVLSAARELWGSQIMEAFGGHSAMRFLCIRAARAYLTPRALRAQTRTRWRWTGRWWAPRRATTATRGRCAAC
jgi:hypothetical protein